MIGIQNSIRPVYIHMVFFFFLCVLGACSAQKKVTYISEDNNELLRPNPGYIQHLKNRSLLQLSANFTSSVSGTMNLWSLHNTNAEQLLAMSSVWLFINPTLYLTDLGVPFFKSLEQGDILKMIKNMGVDGIYLKPIYGSGYAWTNLNRMSSLYQDSIQFEHANELGSQADFLAFRALIGNENMLLGSSLLSVATGLGPDFLLATRSIKEYKGVYALLPVPEKFWSTLPMLQKDTLVVALDESHVELLRTNGVIPKYIMQDFMSSVKKTGWAITDEIIDIDGVKQRFVYRYFMTPERILLNWEDPSYNASRIIQGSILQAIGLQGMALLGNPAYPYLGFTVLDNIQSKKWKEIDELYLYALKGINRSIKQFGAWSFEENPLPLKTLKTVLQYTSFALDSVTAPYAEYSLLTEDTTLLKMMIQEALALDIPFERLVHATPSEEGIALYPISLYTPLGNGQNYISQKMEAVHQKTIQAIRNKMLVWSDILEEDTKVLPFSAPLLVSLSLGYQPIEKLQFEVEKYEQIMNGHGLLLFFKAMQPGILFIAGQDFSAPLPLTEKEYKQTGSVWRPELLGFGGYTFQVLSYNNILNPFGIPSTKSIYPELQTQDIADISFKKNVEKILALRKKLEIDTSKVLGVFTTNTSHVAFLLETKKKDLLVVISNFSSKKTTLLLDIKEFPLLVKALKNSTVESFSSNTHSSSSSSLDKRIDLAGFEGRVFRIKEKKYYSTQ